ncbi:polymeric immunoglobulin receptor-like isoform X2 [Pangasianodon hypophthalmus]|uniref:polymeric immunoglobulin receptor-like isoform X2 n=1 Tax=Pangasianodon hypophthalmus TaxID=310915 RepID=UPI002306EE21|nr:polymeric immunoglobulin receptor-like isoform X2 [Pangasianodon hypophthalmus]
MVLRRAAHARVRPLTHSRMTSLLFLGVLLLQLPGVLCTVTTVGEWTVLEGQSIIVPCHYNPEYTPNVKYWCQGPMKDFCTTLARTNQPESAPSSKARITIADDPRHYVFTVTMRELKEKDSGRYWCGVEIGGIWNKDSTTSFYISVIHGMSVANNEVSAEEGGSVTVQCLYSEKHRENEKRWCRSGDISSCKGTSNGTFSSESLLISDDRKDTVTVTMRRLEKRDTGWYWCEAGEHQLSVYVLVTPRSTTTALDVKTQQHLSEVKAQNSNSHNVRQSLLIVCGALLFLVTWMIWKRFSAVCQASRQFSLKTGESVTIPCHYDRKYIQHKKYWCYGRTFNFCKIQAYANDTQGKVTVTDYPAESLFTVTMNNLQTENTGWYWCVVEIGGIKTPDIKEDLSITVKSDPDLSVMESRVRGEEGGSVTVQCFYSSAYQNTQKQWCRLKDGRCNTFRKTATSQNSAVHISDDGRRSFSVQMSGLKKSDAGWYWCSAGDLQVPVHISVFGDVSESQ